MIGELAEMRHRKALLLSGGQQKLVALGRALGIGTRCLLLDEPFEGIAPALSERLSDVLASLKGKDLTFPNVAIRYESFARADRCRIYDRARRQSRRTLIERIIQRLICGMAPIFTGSYLVLQYKHDAAAEKHGIRSFAHSRNRELKEKMA